MVRKKKIRQGNGKDMAKRGGYYRGGSRKNAIAKKGGGGR